MKNYFICLALILSALSLYAQFPAEPGYALQAPDLPEWVQLMYSEKPDVGRVIQAFEAYYRSHPFVKNQHTQYYKRWLRRLELYGDESRLTPEEKSAKKLNETRYLQHAADRSGPASPWSCIGPFDFDKEAAGVSYAAGAAHLYTVEQAVSNTNILYAGSANAGLWKSTDKGLNWTLMTSNLLISTVYALEIDYTDANIVYFSGANKLYKSINGGMTNVQIGDAAFNNLDHDIKDIVMSPADPAILWLASDQGLYRTIDGGANWTRVLPGSFQEIEFQPGNSNTIYVVRVAGNHTEFFKSVDGGANWTPKAGGYPGIGSISSQTFSAAHFVNASDYIQMASNPNPGSGSLGNFTIEMWVRSDGWSGDPAIFSNKNWNSGWNAGFVIFGKSNGSEWGFNIGTGAQRIDMTGGTINDGGWHHIAVVYRSNGLKELYQDGTQLATSNTNLSGSTSTALNLAIAQAGNLAYNYGFSGDVAEVRIWKKAVSASTIDSWKYLRITNAHPDYADLVHYWPIHEGTGTSVADSKSNNTGTIYGSGGWTASATTYFITSGLTGSDEQKRTEIAVSAENPNVVYALATGEANGGSGLYGVYKSTDAGENWTFQCCGTGPGGVPSPSNFNLMGWDDGGQDDGGQYYYDLALAVSPTESDSVYVCGVNLWVSANSGASFTCPSKWSHSYKTNYVHADIHDFKTYGSDCWIACDGGLFYSNNHGQTWERRMLGIAGTDFWGFGAGFQDGQVMLGGTYHNGTLLKDGNTYTNGWLSTDGGDNTRGYVNPGRARIAYSDYNKKLLSGSRALAPTTYSFDKMPNTSGNMEFHPRCYDIIYSPVDAVLWKTTDDGLSWSSVYDFGSGNEVEAVKIAWSDPDIMYAVTNPGFYNAKKLWRSTNGGTSWTEITPSNATINNNTGMPFKITVDGTDPNTLWLALTHPYSWYTADGYKIFKSTNGGTSWTNISTSTLDGEHIKNIEYARGSNGGIYIGTARTVYYRNNSMSDWALFNTNLPALTYSTLLIPYYKGGKIRNGTNRSVYEADFYEDTPPQAQISVDKLSSSCSRDTFYFVDRSAARSGATYQWSFPGGTPSTSSSASPKVLYPGPGTYDVALTVTDVNGVSSQAVPALITISTDLCEADTVPGLALSLDGSGDYAVPGSSYNLNSNTVTLTAWIRANGTQSDFAGILFARGGTTTSGLSLTSSNSLRYHWNDVGYSFNSNLTVPNQVWTHVALVITPTSARIYMNGVAATHSTSQAAEAFDTPMRIGSDPTGGRDFKGLIDEVTVWNKALSQSEIRELMNLTEIPADQPNLVAYYQFNETSGQAYDKVGLKHATLSGSAARVSSTVPVGKGFSARATVTTGGGYSFGNTGLTLTFPNSGTYPNGELCVSRINQNPDALPNALPHSTAYWIVKNYGSNSSFSTLTSLQFNGYGLIGTASNVPSDFSLFKRSSYAEGSTWGSAIDLGDAITTGVNGSVLFSTGNSVSSFSQFFITNNGSLPVEWISFLASLEKNRTLLTWMVQQTPETARFVVEKSSDGLHFQTMSLLAALPAGGLHTYNLYDDQPEHGYTYYRIRQEDTDGSISYSPIRAVFLDVLADAWGVSPNPVAAGGILHIRAPLETRFVISIYDETGKQVLSTQCVGPTELNLPVGLPAATYSYRLTSDRFKTAGLLVVK